MLYSFSLTFCRLTFLFSSFPLNHQLFISQKKAEKITVPHGICVFSLSFHFVLFLSLTKDPSIMNTVPMKIKKSEKLNTRFLIFSGLQLKLK